MKKIFFIMVLVMSALVINAQTTTTKTTTTTNAKSTAKTTHASVKVADLPKSITDNIAKDYPGYTAKSATSMTANNATTYQVVVMKGTSSETLVYDKDGMFVKKLASKSGSHHSKKK